MYCILSMYFSVSVAPPTLQVFQVLYVTSDKSRVTAISKEKRSTDEWNWLFYHKPCDEHLLRPLVWEEPSLCFFLQKTSLQESPRCFSCIYRFTVTYKHTMTTEDDWSRLTLVKASSEEHFSRHGQGRGRTRLRDLTRRLWSGLRWRWRDAAEEVINELMRGGGDQRRELERQRQLWTSGR